MCYGLMPLLAVTYTEKIFMRAEKLAKIRGLYIC
jgi:hypothetical protein